MTQYPAQLRMKLSSVSSLNSALSADLCVCVCVCVCLCVFVWVGVWVWVSRYERMCIHPMHKRTHARKDACTHARASTPSHPTTYSHMHTHRAYLHARQYAHALAHAHAHARTHARACAPSPAPAPAPAPAPRRSTYQHSGRPIPRRIQAANSPLVEPFDLSLLRFLLLTPPPPRPPVAGSSETEKRPNWSSWSFSWDGVPVIIVIVVFVTNPLHCCHYY